MVGPHILNQHDELRWTIVFMGAETYDVYFSRHYFSNWPCSAVTQTFSTREELPVIDWLQVFVHPLLRDFKAMIFSGLFGLEDCALEALD
jgi:hypothetical protein